uniref:Uncharacterized protein n=1 Tax=Moniliophthora roreri TaxID=221103 RepID=A0A0W0G100_MONRR
MPGTQRTVGSRDHAGLQWLPLVFRFARASWFPPDSVGFSWIQLDLAGVVEFCWPLLASIGRTHKIRILSKGVLALPNSQIITCSTETTLKQTLQTNLY